MSPINIRNKVADRGQHIVYPEILFLLYYNLFKNFPDKEEQYDQCALLY